MSEEENIPEENSKDEILNSKQDEVSENISPPETIEQTETQIETSDITTSDIQNMEVHHHPHVEKKKFKEYLLEGLMIFLAVTLGFFAESYREHIVETTREKEYMKEIVANLKYDTIRCSVNAKVNIEFIHGLDSLRSELKDAINGRVNSNALYYFSMQYAGKFSQAVFNTSAITELKNSGSLRLIENKNTVSELADYYERKITATESFLPSADAVQKTSNELFSLLNLDDFVQSFDTVSKTTYSNTYNYQNILNHKPVLQLTKNNPAGFEQYYNQVTKFETALKYYNFWLYYCKDAAYKLIADIQKGYHLENE